VDHQEEVAGRRGPADNLDIQLKDALQHNTRTESLRAHTFAGVATSGVDALKSLNPPQLLVNATTQATVHSTMFAEACSICRPTPHLVACMDNLHPVAGPSYMVHLPCTCMLGSQETGLFKLQHAG
jgi:hypothetical protein